MPLPFRGLRTFCFAAEYQSFKKAAEALCLTPSAVSHQISDLEDHLGTQLFIRQTRALSLTSEGRQFYEEVLPCLESIDLAARRIKKSKHKTPLLVSMPAFFASEMFIPIVSSFSEGHPDVDLRIDSIEFNASPNPLSDVNIVLSRNRPDAYDVIRLFPIRYIPACSRNQYDTWAREGLTSEQALASATILLHRSRPHAWRQWARHAGVADPDSRQIIFVDSMFALIRAAELGVGVALVPMPVSSAWFESGALVALNDINLVTEDYYWMALKEKPAGQLAVDQLWHWIAEKFQEHA